jgi:hypothetical protein
MSDVADQHSASLAKRSKIAQLEHRKIHGTSVLLCDQEKSFQKKHGRSSPVDAVDKVTE